MIQKQPIQPHNEEDKNKIILDNHNRSMVEQNSVEVQSESVEKSNPIAIQSEAVEEPNSAELQQEFKESDNIEKPQEESVEEPNTTESQSENVQEFAELNNQSNTQQEIKIIEATDNHSHSETVSSISDNDNKISVIILVAVIIAAMFIMSQCSFGRSGAPNYKKAVINYEKAIAHGDYNKLSKLTAQKNLVSGYQKKAENSPSYEKIIGKFLGGAADFEITGSEKMSSDEVKIFNDSGELIGKAKQGRYVQLSTEVDLGGAASWLGIDTSFIDTTETDKSTVIVLKIKGRWYVYE
jgi:hypothetical protein